MNRTILALAFVVMVSGSGKAQAGVINFDTDASGNNLVGATGFSTSPLTELYAPLGVHFSGPSTGKGGAILDMISSFGIGARSGRNFLAFNLNLTFPRVPETITFDSLMSNVAIYGASGRGLFGALRTAEFQLNAYNTNGDLVDSVTATSNYDYVLLSVSGAGIKSVVIDRLSGSGFPSAFVFDDLSFEADSSSPVPEPASMITLAAGAIGMLGFRMRKRRLDAGLVA